MIKHYQPVSFLVVLAFISCTINEPENNSEFDLTMQNIIDSAGLPGLSICFTDNGETVYSNSFGLRNTETGEKVDESTIFEAASLGKPVTAYCAMKLVEAGNLELDTPMYKYLEYEPIQYDERYKLITPRIVMSHSSGFPNWRRFNEDNRLDIKFTPGTEFRYSGEGYVYLQKVLEKISGKGLDQLAEELLFDPAGMDQSNLVFPEIFNFATGHNSSNEPVESVRPAGPNGAGSMLTTAEDYSKFLQEILHPEFISKELIDTMVVPHSIWPTSDSVLRWGLGVGLFLRENDTLLWHWGDNDSFKAFFMASRKTGKSFVYFANSEDGLSIINRLIGITFGIKGLFWNNQYTEPEYIQRMEKRRTRKQSPQ